MKLFKGKVIKAMAATFAMVFAMSGAGVTAFAEGTDSAAAWAELKNNVTTGKVALESVDVSTNHYKLQGGGYALYTVLVSSTSETVIVESQFKELTTGGKQEFLEDLINVAYKADKSSETITPETVDDLFKKLQSVDGMGSQLMSSLLADIKPDYSTANNILEPFNGFVGIALGVISIFIMGALGLTMALDIAFVTIPALQIFLGDGGNGQGNTAVNTFSKIVSSEARAAVSESEGGQGGASGGKKSGIGIYFKYRWKGLVVLGICLLYLVQGQIYAGIALLINLLSGFLGF